MQIPFIVMCAGLIAIATLFAVTLWQMQNRHKRQRGELEYEIATLDHQVRSLRDLSSSQSSKIAEYTLTNNKLAEDLGIANRTSEMRRKEMVKLAARPSVSARVTDGGNSFTLCLDISTDKTGDTIPVRTLAHSNKNKEILQDIAKKINARTEV